MNVRNITSQKTFKKVWCAGIRQYLFSPSLASLSEFMLRIEKDYQADGKHSLGYQYVFVYKRAWGHICHAHLWLFSSHSQCFHPETLLASSSPILTPFSKRSTGPSRLVRSEDRYRQVLT